MKTNSINPKEDLQTIRLMMERSSKFLSLSGLSGIFAGVCALVGAFVAYFLILDSGHIRYDEYMKGIGDVSTIRVRFLMAIDAFFVLLFAASGAFYFSFRKSRNTNQVIWTKSFKNLLAHLLIPLGAGASFAVILIYRNDIQLVGSVTLIFYGLALVNAGKFTFGEIHFLGITEIILGILAGVFINYGLLFWAIGFGLMHIIYGIVMYYKYER